MDWIEKSQKFCDDADAVMRGVASAGWFVFKLVILCSFLGGIAYYAITG